MDQRQVEISEKTGVDQATISRWLRDEQPAVTPRSARLFALGYDRPVLEAFVAAGLLTDEEAGIGVPEPLGLESASNERLLAEVGRRFDALGPAAFWPSMDPGEERS
ncbi:MAG: hypothetical protein FWG11_08670 [Promicromonosporaceae bacterium]|nr:hypothetical protein [Promicromonosporaceae bacterium]